MIAKKNPLKTCFSVITFLLIMTFLDICIKVANNEDISLLYKSMFTLNAIYRIVVFVAFCAFIFFYIQKSLLAWYILFITTLISMPLIFLTGIVKPTSIHMIIIPVFMWGCACVYLLKRNKEYKQFVNYLEAE